MTKSSLDIFVLERDKAVKSLNVNEFREFYLRWYKRGIYHLPLPPSDHIIEISMRKMIIYMKSASDQEREEAKRWLLEKGYDTEI